MARRLLILLVLHLCCFWYTESLANEPVLLFPQSTVFQFTIGLSMPIAMGKKGGLVFSSGFQFNYVLPWNLTQFEPMVVHARNTRQVNEPNSIASNDDDDADDLHLQHQQQQHQLSLENIYTSLEDLLDEHGWQDGRECLLRTICELAETPLNRSGQDVVEEIIHLLLTPSEDSSTADYSTRWSEGGEGGGVGRLYQEAERLGRNRDGSCVLAYKGCPKSPLDSFTGIAFR